MFNALRLFDPLAQGTFCQSHLAGDLAYWFTRLLNNIDSFGFLLLCKEAACFFAHVNILLDYDSSGVSTFLGECQSW